MPRGELPLARERGPGREEVGQVVAGEFDPQRIEERVAAWTTDEVAVLRLVGDGCPASVVAEQRVSTVGAVAALLVSARAKAEVTSTRAAVDLARRAGLLD